MIRKAILTLGVLAATASAYAQSKQPCATDEFYREQKAHYPGIAAQEAQLKADIDRFITNRQSNPNAKTTNHDGTPNWPDDVEAFHIPVVVHVISDYAAGATAVSDNDIYGMIDRLNTYYRAANPGLPTSIIAPFRPYIGNAHITFHLANKDPKNQPTSGITRHFSQHASGGDELAKMEGWAPDQYLNIWLENTIGRSVANGVVQAYATFPTSYADNPYSQGVIARADQALASAGSTLAHEVGHFLFLYHVWNSNNSGPDLGVCGDDEVDDTPPTEGHFNRGCRLYDTLCTTGYYKNYDSATYTHMTGVSYPLRVDSNVIENTNIQFNDTTGSFVGQTFTTGTTQSYLGTISLTVGNGPVRTGALIMNVYNAAGTTLITRSEINPGVVGPGTLKFDFKGALLAANTIYKFEIDTVAGQHSMFPLRASNADPYTRGVLYGGVGANTAIPGSDLYFVVERHYRIDYPDTANTQNIMDYSSCATEMFTIGQVARMRGALRSPVGMRSNLVSNTNLTYTGVWDTVADVAIAHVETAPVAGFSANRPFVCADDASGILFTNRTYSNNTTVTWNFDHGASIPTSTSGSVNNTFKEPGWVTVSLAATSNVGTSSLTRSDMVYAADPNPKNPIGYYQDFNHSTVIDSIELSLFPIFNYFGTDHKWELVNNAGYYDNTAIRYSNYDKRSTPNINNLTESPRGDYADFYTPAFNLSSFGNICNVSFFTAGAFRTNKPSEMNDKLEISYSTDCGRSWRAADSLTGGRLGNNGYRNDAFTPSWMGEWREQSVPVITRADQTFFRFRFKAGVADPATAIYGFPPYYAGMGTGNNFYLDRFSITSAPLGVKNGVIVNLGMNVAPNPTSGTATVTLNGGDNSVAELTVMDVTGKLVYSSSVKRASAITKLEIPASALTVKGMYLVKVVTNGATETQKLVVY